MDLVEIHLVIIIIIITIVIKQRKRENEVGEFEGYCDMLIEELESYLPGMGASP
jgi:hypothetical protein